MTLSDTKDGPRNAIAYSMVMVFVTEGRQRSVPELFDILRSAGFTGLEVRPTGEGYALVAGAKPS